MSYKTELISKIKERPCVVICNNDTKLTLLNSIKEICNVSYKSPKEAQNDLCGSYDRIAIYEIKHLLNVKYDRAENIYNSLILGEMIKDEDTKELRNKLTKYYSAPKKYTNKRIIVCDVLSPELYKALESCEDVVFFEGTVIDTKTPEQNKVILGKIAQLSDNLAKAELGDEKDAIKDEISNLTKQLTNPSNAKAFKYDDIVSEVEGLASRIYDLLKGKPEEEANKLLDDIAIYIGSSDYVDVIKEVFTPYGIPVRYSIEQSLFNIPAVKKALEVEDIKKVNLDQIKNPDVKNLVIDSINRLVGIDYDLDDLKDELSFHALSTTLNGIRLLPYSAFSPIHEHSFILGVTFKNVPSIHTDDRYYKDSVYTSLGMKSLTELNLLEKTKLINGVKQASDICLSYSINGIGAKFIETDVLKNIVFFNKDDSFHFEGSIERAKLEYKKKQEIKKISGYTDPYLDGYSKHIKIKNYDPSYSKINPDNVRKKVVRTENEDGTDKEIIDLSYSKLETFLECHFKYYAKYILGIRVPSDSPLLGSTIHKYLEEYVKNPSYTLRDAINEINKEQEAKNDILYVLEEPYYSKYVEILGKLVGKIDEFNTKLGITLKDTEAEGTYDHITTGPIVRVSGKVDKVMKNCDTLYIIDYKTGDKISLTFKDYDGDRSKISSDYFKKYQLFTYLLLLNVSFEQFGGVYYERVFPKSSDDPIDVESGVCKMFEPYGYTPADPKAKKAKKYELTEDSYNAKLDELKGLFDKFKDTVLAAEFPANPVDGACEFCEYGSLCYQKKNKGDEE